jgi:secreted trypsin-like serine protease
MNYRQPNNGRWKQIGIVSFYPFRNCQNGNPSGYTRLSYYSNWIRGVVTSSNGMSSTVIKTTKPVNTTPIVNTTPGNTTPANTTPNSSSAPTSTSPTSAAETSSVVSFLLFVYSFVVSLTMN